MRGFGNRPYAGWNTDTYVQEVHFNSFSLLQPLSEQNDNILQPYIKETSNTN